MPSALGAAEFAEKKISTIREMIYGSILYTVLGRFRLLSSGKPVYTLESERKSPKSSAASAIFVGFQPPKS